MKDELNTKERAVLAKAGEMLSEMLGNAGGNDTPDDWFADWTPGELADFDREYNEWNNSPEEHDPAAPSAHWHDIFVFGFLLAKALTNAPTPPAKATDAADFIAVYLWQNKVRTGPMDYATFRILVGDLVAQTWPPTPEPEYYVSSCSVYRVIGDLSEIWDGQGWGATKRSTAEYVRNMFGPPVPEPENKKWIGSSLRPEGAKEAIRLLKVDSQSGRLPNGVHDEGVMLNRIASHTIEPETHAKVIKGYSELAEACNDYLTPVQKCLGSMAAALAKAQKLLAACEKVKP